MTQEQEMTADQQQQWVRDQYQVATKYLASQGLVTESVVVEESRYLIPFMSVWKLKVIDGTYFWAICGDVPSDHSVITVASNAREAVRYFSLKWQIQAENLLNSADKEQKTFANLLIRKAENLYEAYEQERFWKN